MKSRGLQTQAFIISDYLLFANVTDKLMEMFARLEITAHVFTDIEEAKIWLEDKVKA